ncbi:hypothetical protein PI87_16355 [Ralstonia sp. A12]|uniref:hypothetical protein n=1 Tax=Ralstonia sp. A12 TaxID=1217052 RepID=UPI000573630D|nr:hypothetical protein [Ralstonia sp. A12]KHK54092.1 hypothetical protein PI87_16355 [Ralstonia sp. A12]
MDGFAEAFGDIFGDVFPSQATKLAHVDSPDAGDNQRDETGRERRLATFETQARPTGERVREIVSDQSDKLADFVESCLLDQREILERQHAVQLDQLSKILALVSQMQGASDPEPTRLDNLIRETIDATVRDVTFPLRFDINVLQRTVEQTYKWQAAPLAWIVGEMFNDKARLMQRRTRPFSGRRRCKVNLRERRYGAAA